MKRSRYNRSAGMSWGKWIILIASVLFIAVIALGVTLYNQTMNGKNQGLAKAKDEAIRKHGLAKAAEAERFSGNPAYNIVFGEDKSHRKKIIFMPVKSKVKAVTLEEKDIISRDHALDGWQRECASCSLVRIGPAMIRQEPLWEITYKDQASRYVYDYISMEDGELREQFRLSSMFK